MDELSALQASGLFGSSTVDELAPLRPALRRRSFARGAHLFYAGEPTGQAIVVLQGLVKTCHLNAAGRESVISVTGPLESVGAFHLFATDSRRSFDCVAVERSECLIIARDVLMYHLEGRTALMRRLAASLLAQMVRESETTMLVPAAGDVAGRLAHRLLDLARRHGEAEGGAVRIRLPLSQSLIAGLTGDSRETVNRALAGLVARAVVARDRDGLLVIRDTDELRRILHGGGRRTG